MIEVESVRDSVTTVNSLVTRKAPTNQATQVSSTSMRDAS